MSKLGPLKTGKKGQTVKVGETILAVENLKMYFPVAQGFFKGTKPLKAVDRVNFDLKAGETLAIVGESGSGKSTIGRAVLQLLTPTGGKVVWMGKNIAGLGAQAMRKHRADLQIVFQDPLASLNPRMTVGDIIAEPLTSLYPKMSK
ncbi:ATP-binding cassette domain-containing protein, partial [bacterium AH-315-P15]|nr:ATP-binding cassette domain-containing protein [bacterium AH-315-P15]